MSDVPSTRLESRSADTATTAAQVNTEPLADIFSARAPDLDSAPCVEARWRVEDLYRELAQLGLQQQVFEFATVGYTVVPPENVGSPDYIARLRAAGRVRCEVRVLTAKNAAPAAGRRHVLAQAVWTSFSFTMRRSSLPLSV